MIAFRKKHPVISRNLPPAHCGLAPLSVCGTDPDAHEITMGNRVLGVLYAGRLPDGSDDDVVYLVINAYWEPLSIRLPALPKGKAWGLSIYTDAAGQQYYHEKAVFLDNYFFSVSPRSVAVFTLYRA